MTKGCVIASPFLPVIATFFIVIASEARQSQESKNEKAVSRQLMANG